jgi:cobalt/nickel transport system permease protein
MNKWKWIVLSVALIFACVLPASAMHLSEGILPAQWAAFWFVVAIPFVAWGLRDLRRRSNVTPVFKPMVALIGAAVFVISCMPIPVPTAGSCSHPCGTGLAAILIGPQLTVLVTSVALLLQALFLSHGGLTTLGANISSMGIAGGFVGFGVFHLARKLGSPLWIAAFLAGMLSDWATYATTSFELASALHGNGSFLHMFTAVALSFLPTQLPLGILEGAVSAGVYCFIVSRRPALLESLRIQRIVAV